MYHFTVSGGSGFHDRLRHSWVWVNSLDQFMTGSLEFADRYNLGDHFSDISTNQVCSQNLSVFLIKYQFHETVFCSGCRCFSLSRERELSNSHFVSGFFCFRFSISYRCDFRGAIRTARDISIIQRFRMMACDFLYTDDSFC